MRLLSRSLAFDLALAVLALAGVAVTDGVLRTAAGVALVLAIVWVPWDLVTERRAKRT